VITNKAVSLSASSSTPTEYLYVDSKWSTLSSKTVLQFYSLLLKLRGYDDDDDFILFKVQPRMYDS
jgi:hypothetical protein